MTPTSATTLRGALDSWEQEARARVARLTVEPRAEGVGRVERSGDGVATVSGLPDTRLDEVLLLAGDRPALAIELLPGRIGCVLLDDRAPPPAGAHVRGTGAVARAPVGSALLGRVVDALGRPLDGGPAITPERVDPVERAAPAIEDRALVEEPLLTGVAVVDAMFPIGRGQRELVIGDRATGKTALAVDVLLAQRRSDVVCVYVAVGQKASAIRGVIEAVRRHGAFDRTAFVVGEADAAPGLQWLAPFAGVTIAERFMEGGGHALVVLDDLTKHAAVHRQLALLLRQPVGREAYPGDVFYLHARLLERAAKLGPERGGGSLTALPIAETQGGNLAGYIPTNLISITDGQLVLDGRLFAQGQKPALDVGLSVSRVGGKAQPPVLRGLAERLRLEYAQFLELEVFTRLGTTLDERTRRVLDRGRRIRALLRQPREAPLRLGAQVAQLRALSEGRLDPLPLEAVARFRERLPAWLEARAAAALEALEVRGTPGEAAREAQTVLGDATTELAAEVAGEVARA